MGVRRALAAVATMLVVMATMACEPRLPGGGSNDGDHGDHDGQGEHAQLGRGDGFVDAHDWRRRQVAYLRFATEQLDRGSPTNVLAHFIRADRDRHFHFDRRSITPADFAPVFAKIDAHRDTSDFDMLQLVALWYGHRRE